MNPIDYRIEVQNPIESSLKGLQSGLAIRSALDQQAQLTAQRASQLQMQSDLSGLADRAKNGTAGINDYKSIVAKYPQFGEHFKQSIADLSEDEKNQRLSRTSQIYAALVGGRPEIAQDLLSKQADALSNSGKTEEANAASTLSKVIASAPDQAEVIAGTMLAGIPGGDKIIEGAIRMRAEQRAASKAPYELTEAQANAQKAAVAAKFAESNAAVELQKKGWDITKIQEDINIAKRNAAIAAINSQIAREGNAVKREENQVRLQEMLQKRDDIIRSKTADAESARSNMDNMLNTADRILNTPMGIVGAAAGPVSSRTPTLRQDTADFETLVETLGSQAFLAQIPNIKGMGSLSNAEGEKLQAALQNFSLKQSPERLMTNVKEAQRLILKARKNITARFGVPETVPNTPEVQTSGSDIDALILKYSQP